MSLRRPPAHLTLILLLAVMASAGRARAICTANEILNNPQEPGCTAAMIPCTITKSYTIDNGCTLDFGTHTVTSNGNLSIGAGTAAIRAASLTLVGAINGIGGVNDPRGGMITITTTGGFVVALGGGINVSGNNHGGDVIVRAGGSVSILGKIQADFLRKEAAGGLIDISADGDITTGPGPTSVLSAQGGNDSDGGGEIDLTADGAMTLLTTLDVDGLDGGFLELDAGGKLVMQGADASGAGDAGSGGCIDVVAGASAEVHGAIIAKGASGTFMTGGCGGLICFDGGRGDITIANGAVVNADGASPDGGGGQITLLAQGSAFLNGQVQARGPDGETCGGDLCVETGFDVTVASLGPVDVLDAGGGDSGGEIELVAGRNMMINGQIDCSGRATGSIGGDVTLRAGQIGSGSLTLTSAIDVRSNAPCGVENGCGQGGSTDLRGCNVTVSPTGALLATGPDGGENDLTASEQITVQGTMDATHTVAGHDDGSNRFIFRPTKFPITQGNGIKPDFLTLTVTTCPELGETVPPCLTPCPVCGDGRVDFPETCDLGIIPPHSCSGCSAYCRLENCDDGLFCSLDSCDIMFGCDHEGIPGCTEPTPTVTNTRPTSTATPTVTSTPSMTATPTVTSTALPSNTPSVTPTTSATSTASPSSTSSATTTATAIPTATNVVVDTPSPTASATVASTATVMATATATVTASATATATATSSPAATNTVPPACAGDCSGNGEVTVNELIVGVNIALGNTGTDACPAFDRNADGMVSISELIAAVNAALNGC